MKLSLTDTPGFGDAVDNTDSWDPIVAYITQRSNDYFMEEIAVDRMRVIPDARIHACIYCIPPNGHG